MRSHRSISVPFLSFSDSLAQDSGAALEGGRFQLVSLGSWDDLIEVPTRCSVRVVAADSLDDAEISRGVARVFLKRPDARVVVVCRPFHDADGVARALSSSRRVISLPDEASELRVLLGRAWADGRAADIRDRVREALDVPFPLRLFLKSVLQMHLLSAPSAAAWRVWQHVDAHCEATGVGRSQVYLQAGKLNVRPKRVVDAWSAVQVLVVRDIEGLPWPETELRSGYGSASGLRSLLLRGVGYTPAQLPDDDAEYWFRWLEAEVLEPILRAAKESRTEAG